MTGKKCGKSCEIWSRSCGYHRPVKYWNKGKVSEFLDRKEYTMTDLPKIKIEPPSELKMKVAS